MPPPKLYYLPRIGLVLAVASVIAVGIYVGVLPAVMLIVALCFSVFLWNQPVGGPDVLPGRFALIDGICFVALLWCIGTAVGALVRATHFLMDGMLTACTGSLITIGMIFFLRSIGSSIYWGTDGRCPFLIERHPYVFKADNVGASVLMNVVLLMPNLLSIHMVLFDLFHEVRPLPAVVLLALMTLVSVGMLAGVRVNINDRLSQ